MIVPLIHGLPGSRDPASVARVLGITEANVKVRLHLLDGIHELRKNTVLHVVDPQFH